MNDFKDKLYRIWSIIYPHMTVKQILDLIEAMGPENQHKMYFGIKEAFSTIFYQAYEDDGPAKKIAKTFGAKFVSPDGNICYGPDPH